MLNVKKNPEFKTRCLVYTDSGRFQFDSSYKERGARFVLGLNKSIVQTKNNDNGIKFLFFFSYKSERLFCLVVYHPFRL